MAYCSSFFSTKKKPKGEKIILNNAQKHISDDKKICTIFTNFFSNVVPGLRTPNYCNYSSQKKNTHSLLIITEKFEKDIGVLIIKKYWNLGTVFSFGKKDYSRGGTKSHPGPKHSKKLSDEWHCHQN